LLKIFIKSLNKAEGRRQRAEGFYEGKSKKEKGKNQAEGRRTRIEGRRKRARLHS